MSWLSEGLRAVDRGIHSIPVIGSHIPSAASLLGYGAAGGVGQFAGSALNHSIGSDSAIGAGNAAMILPFTGTGGGTGGNDNPLDPSNFPATGGNDNPLDPSNFPATGGTSGSGGAGSDGGVLDWVKGLLTDHGADILKTGGAVAGGAMDYLAKQQALKQQADQFAKTYGLQQNSQAMGASRALNAAPMADKAMYLAQNFAPPQPYQPRDITRGVSAFQAGPQGGGAQAQLAANDAASANYKAGAGGYDTSTLKAILARLQMSPTPTPPGGGIINQVGSVVGQAMNGGGTPISKPGPVVPGGQMPYQGLGQGVMTPQAWEEYRKANGLA